MSSNKIEVDKECVTEVKIEKYSFMWKMKNFSFLCKQPGEFLLSPVFTFGSKDKIDWRLKIYPNGDEKENENYLSLFLNWEHNKIINGHYKLSFINNQQELEEESIAQLEEKSIDTSGYGFSQFISRNDLNKSGLLLNDCLIIHCEITLSLDDVGSVIENKKRKLEVNIRPSWFKKLFLEESLSDIKLIAIASGKSLSAHKNVLAACSPVFEAMFKHDMLEQKLGEVKIKDANHETIKEMLRFIYLGEVEDLKSIVFELVMLADKYQITELIEFCEMALMDQISVDNVLQVTTLADSYNMKRLKTRALDFGCLHLKEVINSNDFKSSVYPQAMQSIIKAFGQQR